VATATRAGAPSLRFVLLKGLGPRGLVFFTDARSRKGRELARNPRAAATLWWQALGRQVRVEGRVERLPAAAADRYWQRRPRDSRLSAAVSRQSAPLRSRAELRGRRRRLAARLDGDAVPRPDAWGGFRLVPDRVEFWRDHPDRLHWRELYVRTPGGWRRRLLQP